MYFLEKINENIKKYINRELEIIFYKFTAELDDLLINETFFKSFFALRQSI